MNAYAVWSTTVQKTSLSWSHIMNQTV